MGAMLTALYDGKCHFCRSSCAVLQSLDWWRRIDFIDLHASVRWRGTYPALSTEQLLSQIHVLDEQGRLFVGYFGLCRLLRELPLCLPLWLLLQVPGTTALGQRAYRGIARRRYRLNRLWGDVPSAGDCDICQPPG